MQITRTNSYLSLPSAQESQRERSASEFSTQLVQAPGVELQRATRAIEEIQSAERLLNRRSSQASYSYSAQEGRQQRALAAYQSLQQSDERAYVSQVLGIDVYA